MNLIILALVIAIFSVPQVAHEQVPAVEIVEILPPQNRDVPEILARIATCESQDRHFNDKGGVLKGGKNKYDIGKYQINILYWGDLADELGHDIYAEDGNEAMALEIYNRYGTSPWKWSKKCWNK